MLLRVLAALALVVGASGHVSMDAILRRVVHHQSDPTKPSANPSTRAQSPSHAHGTP